MPYGTTVLGKNKKFGFTLAEVLITLGIIGVVAAMTLPTLTHNFKKKEIETKLAKIYSTMNNAVLLSKANGTFTDWYPQERYSNAETEEYLKKTILPYLKISKFCTANDTKCSKCSAYYKFPCIIFPDGSSLAFNNNYQLFAAYNLSQKDIPGKHGVSLFSFFLDNGNPKLGAFYPGGYTWGHANDDDIDNDRRVDLYLYNSDRETLKKYCSSKYTANNSARTNTTTCALLIMQDGWKIADDYPIKF